MASRINFRSIGSHLSAWPRLPRHVQEKTGADLGDVKNPAENADRALAVLALAHAHGKLVDLKTRAMQQKNYFRLGIIFRVPMRVGMNDFLVTRAKPAGAVGDVHPCEQADERSQHPRAAGANHALAILDRFEESRADDEIDVACKQMIDEANDF